VRNSIGRQSSREKKGGNIRGKVDSLKEEGGFPRTPFKEARRKMNDTKQRAGHRAERASFRPVTLRRGGTEVSVERVRGEGKKSVGQEGEEACSRTLITRYFSVALKTRQVRGISGREKGIREREELRNKGGVKLERPPIFL